MNYGKGWSNLIYAGCDLGIISAKAAIIDNSNVLALEVLPYKGHPRRAAFEVMDRALAKARLYREQIEYYVATGFGKKAVPYADEVVGDLICHHRSIREVNADVRAVIDVGGQSFAAFNIDNNGLVSETAVTDKCASGVITAKTLDVNV
jgi:(R)-2-hydroxyacyl-CoA dehydratese activating ATPase